MKTMYKSIMLIAAAAMTFAGCNVEPIETPEETTYTHTVTFIACQDDTKTTMDINNGVASFDWDTADINYFYIYENAYTNKAKDAVGRIDENGKMQITATFENGGTAPFKYFGFFAPTFFTYPQVPAAQTDNGKYDPMADILIAKPVTIDASQSGKAISFQFKRIVAINIMTLKGLTAGETIKEVTIDSDKSIAGKYDHTKGEWYNSTDKQITVSANSVANENGQAVIYFVSAPVEDAQLTITATTATGKTYSKELAKTISFSEGGVKAFGVTMGVERMYGYAKVTSTPADWGGEYLIADGNKVFNGLDAANDYVEGTISNNVLKYEDGMAKVSIEKMTGGYSLKILNGDKANKYISGKSGSNSIVYGTEAVANEITIDDDGLVTILSNSTSLRYNATSGNDRFRYYKTSTTGNDYHIPALYRYQEIVPPEEVHVASVSIDATLDLTLGETKTLVPTIAPENATNKSVTWSSNNQSVATVDQNGLVSAVAAGTAAITVTTQDGSKTATCNVTVTDIDYSVVYTSNVTLSITGGTSASDAKVSIKGTEYKAIKAGTSSKAGACVVTIPAGTKTLHFHAMGWNKETVTLSAGDATFALTSDSGISGSGTTFTLTATTESYFTLDPKGATSITFSAANTTTGKRFVIWGVNAK